MSWHHANCFIQSSPSTQVEKLSGWESLSPSDQSVVHDMVKSSSAVKSGENAHSFILFCFLFFFFAAVVTISFILLIAVYCILRHKS